MTVAIGKQAPEKTDTSERFHFASYFPPPEIKNRQYMDQCYYLEKESIPLTTTTKKKPKTNIRTVSSPNPVLDYINTNAIVMDKSAPVLVMV